MNQIIIAFAGKKQAGKNTSYSCIRLWRPEAQEFSFADSLKRMCIDILGLEEWQVYGTDEQKNTPISHLLWDNFPIPAYDVTNGNRVFIGHPNGMACKYNPLACATATLGPNESFGDSVALKQSLQISFDSQSAGIATLKQFEYDPNIAWHDGDKLYRKRGPMTAREVLQYYGTEIFRHQYHNVWADACIRKIRKSQCQLAIITDCRFPNEVDSVQAAGGKVVKLTKVVFPDDKHPSETALDAEHFDQGRFDAILDNAEMDVPTQCEALYALLRRWGIVNAKHVSRIHV